MLQHAHGHIFIQANKTIKYFGKYFSIYDHSLKLPSVRKMHTNTINAYWLQ